MRTFHVMEALERLLLARLRKRINIFWDPLQFCLSPFYKPNVMCLISIMRIMYFDFSSPFNNIQPVLLSENLQKTHLDASTISWITDYLIKTDHRLRDGMVLYVSGRSSAQEPHRGL